MVEELQFPTDWLRGRFPSLSIEDDGTPRIYLDNPAGTQVPQSVADAVSHCILFSNANLGGHFKTSIAAEKIIEQGHLAMADFFGCDAQEVIIGPNMTSLTYHFSRMIGRGLKAGDEIIITKSDHEGNVSPWLQLADDLGLVIKKLPFDLDSWQIEPDALQSMITDRTKLLALNYSSNLTGSINPAKALVAIAKAAGVLTYVDAVQFAPHGFIDVKELDCDFLICSSYKFFGPHLGILYGRKSVLESLDPYKCRCSTNELPYRFETGTPQIELVAGLTASIDHFAALGAKAVAQSEGMNRRELIQRSFVSSIAYEEVLASKLISGLDEIDGVTIQGISDQQRMMHRVPTVSFTLEDIAPDILVQRLNEENIFCWSGHNYAWEVVHHLGIDPELGVVRIGIANYNTSAEIEHTLAAITRNVSMLRQKR